jgi:hypothetical protein
VADPNDNLGVGGGAPPLSPLGGPSLDAEEKAMKSGKGRMLAAMIIAALAAVVLLVVFMMSGGEGEQYGTLGRNINGLRGQYFDAFWACALRPEDPREIRDNSQLAAKIHERAQQGRARYATHLREECMPKLADLGPALEVLYPPDDLAPKLVELKDSVQALRSATSAYVAYIQTLGDQGYDAESEEAREHVTAMTRAWYDYRRIHGELNDAIAAKLEE